MAQAPSAAGWKAVVAYKAAKAAVELLLAGAGALLVASGLGERLHEHLLEAHRHLAAGWSRQLADLVARGTAAAHLGWAAAALAADGLYTGVEAWALQRRKPWAPWLVVAALAAFVPFEALELARRPAVTRAALLVINLVVAAYLARGARGREVAAG